MNKLEWVAIGTKQFCKISILFRVDEKVLGFDLVFLT